MIHKQAMAQETKWWSDKTIALVTGANKGIGFEIVRVLAEHGFTTILTSRDEERGRNAVKKLTDQGLNVVYHQLDVGDPESVQELASWVSAEYGEVHILINNAGVMLLLDLEPIQAAKTILNSNYYGLKAVTEAILPLMKPGARIINISSKAGDLKYLKNEWREKLDDIQNLTISGIDECIKSYLQDVQNHQITAGGWPTRASSINPNPEDISHYRVSKIAVNAYVRLLHRQLDEEENKISVNCICPGLTATDMISGLGGHPVEIGIDTAIWLALLPPFKSPSGEFFMLRKSVGYSDQPFYVNGVHVDIDIGLPSELEK